MRILSRLKLSVRSVVVAGVIAASAMGVAAVVTSPAHAESSDCTANSVIYCGGSSASTIFNRYSNGDGHNSANSIQHIYNWFGISGSDMQTFKQSAQEGSVSSNGNVYVGSKLVATNALTAGRQNISAACGGSTYRVQGGTPFYTRRPCVSFQQSSLTALVVMKNGVFQFAILKSCGNPVTGTPKEQPKPDYTITKEVSKAGENNYHQDVTVQAGDKVAYRITVKSTGNEAAKNINVKDNLPSNVDYIGGTLTRNGNPANASQFFASGVNIDSLAPGETVVFHFQAVVAPHENVDNCHEVTYNNVAQINAPDLPIKGDHATVHTNCAPSYECTNLNATTADQQTFKFTGKAAAQHGATITGYQFDFGDGKSANSNDNTVTHTYTKSGTYTARLTVVVKVNGNTRTVTSKDCTQVVKPNIHTPAYSCDSLSATADSDTKFTFTGQASASGGATITSYQFNFGDGKSVTGNSNVVSHTYAQAGTYTARLTAHVKVNGQNKTVTSEACTTVVKPTHQTPAYSCDSLSAKANSRTSYTFTGQASASGGATITGYQYNFGDGQSTTTGPNGTTAEHTYAQPGTYTAVLTALISVNGTAKQVTSPACKTKVTVTPPPKAECTGLTAQIGENRMVTVTATYTPGATLTSASYDFGDGSAPIVNNTTTASHTYTQDGNYLVKAVLSFTVEGQTTTSKCQVPVSFTPNQPVYTCDAFSLTASSNRTVTATNFKTTATNGAVFTHADINWGDGSAITSTPNVIGQTHTFAQDGTYTVSVSAHFTVNGVDVSASGVHCQQPVTFNTPPCTPPNDTTPECSPTCAPPNDTKPECTTTTTTTSNTPTTLVNTGAGSVAGIFAATTAIGTLGYRFILNRRLSRQ